MSITYLHVRGTLEEDMAYRPRPGRESARPGPRKGGDPQFRLVLLDATGRELLSLAPRVLARCGPADSARRFDVRASLPLHPQGTSYELWRGHVLLHRAEIAAAPPSVTTPRCRKTRAGLRLSWECADERAGLSYTVAVRSTAGQRLVLARGLTERGFRLDPEAIPASGDVRVVVEACDGVRSSEVEVTTLMLPARPPAIHILAPGDGVTLAYGHPLPATGCCLDASGQPCPPQGALWLFDGEPIAEGSFVAAVARPRPGRHKLTLAYASNDMRAETSVTVVVDSPDRDCREWAALVGEPLDDCDPEPAGA